MSERPVRIGETRFMSFFEYLARFGKDPRFVSVPTVALAICQARMSGFSREEREDCLAGRGVGREIVSEAEAWLSRRCGTLRVTGPERLFVRRMIEAGRRWSGSEGVRLETVSPVAMGRDADRQRRLFLETLHADWRGLPIEDEIDQRNVPINQLSSDGVSLLNCRHALLVFPEMTLRDQYLFFLGTVMAGALPLKAVVCETSMRFGRTWLHGIVRLSECPDRVPGLQPANKPVREDLRIEDCDLYFDQVRDLYRWTRSDPDSRYRCSIDLVDPYVTVMLPGTDPVRGCASRVLFLASPGQFPDALF